MKHVSIKVTGLVQGVYFRASTKEMADTLNILGFVRNEPDGGVYIEAEGEGDNLKRFVEWCGRGPSRAVVQSCDIREGEIKNYQKFEIRR